MPRIPAVLMAALVAWSLAATAAVAEGRWQQLENNPSCAVWNFYPLPNQTVTWSGACAIGKAQGRGTQVWRYLEDGEWKESKYTGEMKDGRNNGRGVLWASGDRYEGDWKDGNFHGRGVLVFASGNRYEGEFRDNKPNGSGTYWRGGKTYSGYWTNGCFKQGERRAWIGTTKEACGLK